MEIANRTFKESIKSEEIWHGIAWTIPVALKLISINETLILGISAIYFVYSMYKIFRTPTSALVILPYFTLLSPIGGFISIAGTRVLLSDLLFIVLCIQFLYLMLLKLNRGQVKINKKLS